MFQIERYRFLCKNSLNEVPIICIAYFHNASSDQIGQLLHSDKIRVFGYDNFEKIKSFILWTPHTKILNKEKIQEFLRPPAHKKEDGKIIKLTQQQKDLVLHTPNSWRRVKGVAGAGKTIIITQKAANIASCGKKVLIICFNKTLKTYIKSNLDKTQKDFDWNLIECHHFHEFMKIFIEENDLNIENKGGSFEEYEKKLLENVAKLIKSQTNHKARQYDAILIDEAQDFKKEWFDLLLYFLSHNDELLLVADDKQNLYDREISWINGSMAGYGYKFKGAWGILKDNIRQRKFPEVIEESNRFFQLFLKDYLNLHPHKTFGDSLESQVVKRTGLFNRLFSSVELFWKNIQPSVLRENLISAHGFLIKKGYRNKDIVILVPSYKIGDEVMETFKSQEVQSMLFNEDLKNQKSSVDEEKIQIATIHSFKGLENGVIIFVSHGKDEILSDFETYVAITRATECLIVLNTKEKYREYGDSWKKYLRK